MPREQKSGSQPIHLHLPARARCGIREGDDRHAAEAKRHVQIEDPAPRQRIGDVAADKRARDEATPQTPLKSACVRARSASVYSSPMIVMLIGMIAPAPRPCIARAAINVNMLVAAPDITDPIKKMATPSRYRSASSIQVRQSPPYRDRGGRRQEIRGKDPTVMRQAAERRNHRRHRGTDDRRFERAETHAEQEPGGDGPSARKTDLKMWR